MRTQLTHVRANSIRPLLAATLALAITLTLSCSGGDDNEGGGGGGNNNNPFAGNPEYEWMKEYNKYYHPDEEFQQYDRRRCRNGVIEHPCEVDGNEVWYNPLTHGCGDMGLGTREICGSQLYISVLNNSWERCRGGVLEEKCGDDWYNENTQYCSYEWDPNTGTTTVTIEARERCGNKYYDPYDLTFPGSSPVRRCQNGVVQTRCGGWIPEEEALWYNEDTQYCSSEWNGGSPTRTIKARERCGNRYLEEPDYERCNNEVVEYICGGTNGTGIIGENATWYNIITHYCDHNTGTLKAKLRCGS